MASNYRVPEVIIYHTFESDHLCLRAQGWGYMFILYHPFINMGLYLKTNAPVTYVIESLNMYIETWIIKITPEISKLNQCVSLSVATTTISISKVLIFRPQKMKAPLFLITCVDTYWIFTSFKWIFITFKGN